MNYIKRAKYFQTKKRLGQNFLVESNIIQKIVEEANINAEETVLEIGAGIGFVTEQLAQKASKVVAIELDDDAIKELNSIPFKNIEIINEDILNVDISQLVDKPVKIVANIPYYITSPILVHLLGEIDEPDFPNRKSIKEIFLMVQYEVAKRIVADEKSPGKEYGLLSILCNYWAETEFICKVPAKSFYPAPKVDSAIVKLKIRDKPLVDLENPSFFKRIINSSFSMRRKNIKNALIMNGFDSTAVNKSLEKLGIDPSRRGETFSVLEFKALCEQMQYFIDLFNYFTY